MEGPKDRERRRDLSVLPGCNTATRNDGPYRAFRDRTLLDTACSGDGNEFQRLEFLGDAVADAVLARWIHRWSTGTVAVAVGAREAITSDRTLARISRVTGLRSVLSPALRAVPQRDGDVVEAVVGAAFLDGGWPAATAVCETVFASWLHEPHTDRRAARIDTAITRTNDGWGWRSLVWATGAPSPVVIRGTGAHPIDAEIDALCTSIERLDRSTTNVWVELSEDLRAAMADTDHTPHTSGIQTLRALLVPFDGVWFVPSERIDTTVTPRSSDDEPDGVLTGFERLAGHDFRNDSLERLALCPGPEQRRLAFVGGYVLKSAASICAFTDLPASSEDALSHEVTALLALTRLHELALDVGLVDLLLPGERPAHPTQVIKAALGAITVDDGVEPAVDLASRWLEQVRVDGSRVRDLCSIRCSYGNSGADVDIHLVTPRRTASWAFTDRTVDSLVRALEGICTAIDSLTPQECTTTVLIDGSKRLRDLVEQSSGATSEQQAAIDRLLHRIDERGLAAAWHPLRR